MIRACQSCDCVYSISLLTTAPLSMYYVRQSTIEQHLRMP